MFFLIVGLLLFVSTLGGWFCARRRQRLLWLACLILLPVVLYSALAIFMGATDDESWGFSFTWWLIGFGYIGVPMLLWAASAGAGFWMSRLRNKAAARNRPG